MRGAVVPQGMLRKNGAPGVGLPDSGRHGGVPFGPSGDAALRRNIQIFLASQRPSCRGSFGRMPTACPVTARQGYGSLHATAFIGWG